MQVDIAPPTSPDAIETLEHTIGADGRLTRKLLAFSKKRDFARYDSTGSISNQELEQILVSGAPL